VLLLERPDIVGGQAVVSIPRGFGRDVDDHRGAD
jgi:hypothetical protein